MVKWFCAHDVSTIAQKDVNASNMGKLMSLEGNQPHRR